MSPPWGREASYSGAARGFQRLRNRDQVSLVQPSKRTSAVNTNRTLAALVLGVENAAIAAWGDALLALPNATPGQRYRDIFTDCIQLVTECDGVIGLPLAELLEHFPVALLERIA